MGIGPFSRLSTGSSSTCVNTGAVYPRKDVNPNPSNFNIVKIEQIGRLVVGLVEYPNCTNFEGQKIIIWQDTSVKDIVASGIIDPHFADNNKIIARFRPNMWSSAVRYAKFQNGEKV
jgi:hypothetical protein